MVWRLSIQLLSTAFYRTSIYQDSFWPLTLRYFSLFSCFGLLIRICATYALFDGFSGIPKKILFHIIIWHHHWHTYQIKKTYLPILETIPSYGSYPCLLGISLHDLEKYAQLALHCAYCLHANNSRGSRILACVAWIGQYTILCNTLDTRTPMRNFCVLVNNGLSLL